MTFKLWLDDVRDPVHYGCIGWIWVKTADEAIQALETGDVERASLDHDLTIKQTFCGGMFEEIYDDWEKSGYDVVKWLEEHPEFWPPNGVEVHSMNPAGMARMKQVIEKHYGKGFRPSKKTMGLLSTD